ncbi:MAG: RND transporter, partial [Betaproteobacteria bacterium HGW-Betaproteobacteria-18]
MKRIPAALFLLFLLAGCAVGTDYRRPAVDAPAAWRFEEKEAVKTVNPSWWEQFQDPVLNDLIRTALNENKDLLIATARVDEFMGRYGVTRADLFPQASLGATAGRQRLSSESYSGVAPGATPTYENYGATLSTSWEIDLWGKLRRATEAARADLLSTEEARRTVILTLAANVANAYLNLLNLDRQLDIAVRTAETRKESLDLFELRFSGGLVSELELNQVRSEYEQARATIPSLANSVAQQETALNLLLGRNPGPVKR